VLSDPVHRADEFLVGEDASASEEIADQGDGREDGRPRGAEVYCSPGLIAHHLSYDEVADIPSYHQKHIEQTEECLHLAVMIYKYGIGGDGSCGQKNSQQRPAVKVMLAQRVGIPQVIETCHLKTFDLEGTYLHTKTDDGHNDGRHQI
jgi:hypothetical protein